jgi:hypothetical protein
MKIAVTDANIFIDLIAVDLLNSLFDLKIEFHTTFPVFDQLNLEQQKNLIPYINSKKLVKYNFSYEELMEIYEIKFPNALETADRSVFYYCNKINASILSGDKRLKTYCESKSIEVKGILWLFDELVATKLITVGYAASKLQLLLTINDRLPYQDCLARIDKWGS